MFNLKFMLSYGDNDDDDGDDECTTITINCSNVPVSHCTSEIQ